MFSDVGPLELITIGIIAVLLFGPDKLPEMIQNVTGFLRKVREFSDNAKQEIRDELGPEFKDFEFEDLHPKTFVRKHVLDGAGDSFGLAEIRDAFDPRQELHQVADAVQEAVDGPSADAPSGPRVVLTKGTGPDPSERPSFDPDAT
ncbi:sec-independent translocase [Streptomyces sp. NPDC048295]|uniref:sec-independent translocase n=1 Tax=Streptomyces sp. NPDC048295 TaxID=3154617 RepID=UPI003443FA7F